MESFVRKCLLKSKINAYFYSKKKINKLLVNLSTNLDIVKSGQINRKKRT